MDYCLPQRPHTVGAMSNPRHMYSDSIMKILEEIEREAAVSPSKPKIIQKNHLKENFKRLKEIQEKAKQKSAEKQPLKPIRALNKYSQVQPKVSAAFNAFDKERLHSRQIGTADPCRRQAPLSPCLSTKSEGHRTLQHYKSLPQLNQVTEDQALAKLSSAETTIQSLERQINSLNRSENAVYTREKNESIVRDLKHRHQKEVLQLNEENDDLRRRLEKASVYSPKDRRRDERERLYNKSSHGLVCIKNKQKCDTKSELKHRLGHIPSYLTERKKQWENERERQLKLLEEANIPPGHTLLPDEERLETLELLKKNQDELLQSLASLPVRNDTLRLKQYKDDLERQLAKVEEGIKIFSRPKVLIKNDT